MTAIGTLPVLLGVGLHAARPAASAVGKGGLYSCTTHSLVYQTDGSSWSTWASLSGTGLTDPMTTRGDIIYRDSSNVTNRLAIPAAGQVLGRSGSDLGAIYPPGYEYNYTAKTSDTSITATTEGTANTVVTASGVAFDGSTVIVVHFFSPGVLIGTTYNRVCLFDDTGGGAAVVIGLWTGLLFRGPVKLEARLTPSAATHTYSVRAYVDAGTGTVQGGANGTGALAPAFIRITKAA